MAWKTPTVKKQPVKSAKNDDSPSFPGLKPGSSAPGGKTQYEELQQNEVMVLESIYGEDFVDRTAAQGAWKV